MAAVIVCDELLQEICKLKLDCDALLSVPCGGGELEDALATVSPFKIFGVDIGRSLVMDAPKFQLVVVKYRQSHVEYYTAPCFANATFEEDKIFKIPKGFFAHQHTFLIIVVLYIAVRLPEAE